MNTIAADILRLTAAERLALPAAIWGSLPENPRRRSGAGLAP
ncbi:MAG: hypothetical protein ACLPWS_19935 [Rhodomicrobium sp.]